MHERSDGDIHLASVIVSKGNRQQGIGSEFMADLVAYADANGKRVVLSPGQPDDRHGTTSRARLVRFYKRFGFIENKGRNKDYQISEGMCPRRNSPPPSPLVPRRHPRRTRPSVRRAGAGADAENYCAGVARRISKHLRPSSARTACIARMVRSIQAFAHNGHVYTAADGVEKGHVVKTLKHEFAHIARLRPTRHEAMASTAPIRRRAHGRGLGHRQGAAGGAEEGSRLTRTQP